MEVGNCFTSSTGKSFSTDSVVFINSPFSWPYLSRLTFFSNTWQVLPKLFSTFVYFNK